MVSIVSTLSSSLSALNPLPKIGRRVFLGLLENLRIGRITVVVECDGNATFVFDGAKSPVPPTEPSVYADAAATLTVKSDAFWSRLVTGGDMGFAEAYMAAEVDVDDMAAFLLIMVKNKPYLEDTSTPLALVSESVDYLMHSRLANSVKNALSNISAHYDLSNDMFAAFLDPRMQYSCAVWDWADPTDTLEAAQLRKITTILSKAKLTPTTKLLEIGSGWGGLAVEAVRQSGGCEVVTITLSVEQKLLAEDRVRRAEAAGYIPAGRVQVLLCDYRKLPERFPDGHFDALVSVEMIEAVGKEYLPSYFDICHRMLHPDHGIMVLQAITMPERRAEQYGKRADFIQKYIFPGGFLPSITQITSLATESSNGHLIVQHMENYATHYARTLQAWEAKFVATYPTVARAAVSNAPAVPSVVTTAATGATETASDKAYQSVDEIEGVRRRAEIGTDHFYRKFLYYFAYCQAGFAARVIDLYQIVLSREGNETLLTGPFAKGELKYTPSPLES
ncbi:hypothetical protein H9P43_008328 [Blastocladiella emersonii ATCC 22665]|nr:hypothetical protein H9P43_008328 [Blastocladiella emersonii ATCC 22665]